MGVEVGDDHLRRARVARSSGCPAEVVVESSADLPQPLRRDPAPARDVLQERQDVVRPLGTAEGDEEQGVVRANGHVDDPPALDPEPLGVARRGHVAT